MNSIEDSFIFPSSMFLEAYNNFTNVTDNLCPSYGDINIIHLSVMLPLLSITLIICLVSFIVTFIKRAEAPVRTRGIFPFIFHIFLLAVLAVEMFKLFFRLECISCIFFPVVNFPFLTSCALVHFLQSGYYYLVSYVQEYRVSKYESFRDLKIRKLSVNGVDDSEVMQKWLTLRQVRILLYLIVLVVFFFYLTSFIFVNEITVILMDHFFYPEVPCVLGAPLDKRMQDKLVVLQSLEVFALLLVIFFEFFILFFDAILFFWKKGCQLKRFYVYEDALYFRIQNTIVLFIITPWLLLMKALDITLTLGVLQQQWILSIGHLLLQILFLAIIVWFSFFVECFRRTKTNFSEDV